jgi:molybdopterin-guanine dinucleotide biosynthesis protein A
LSFSAVLLAGGKSSRMGQDKATLFFRGVPLWQNQLELLRLLQPVEIFVSAQIDPAWRPSDAKFVADTKPSCGPISGIAAALSRISNDYLIVLAIDMPFITGAYLRSLCERIEPGRGIVPVIEDRAEPLAAIYPRDAATEFGSALSGADFSLQPLIRKLIAFGKLLPIKVSDDERPYFRNLNEPTDLASP